MFNLESWLEQFNPAFNPDRPSPDFNDPEWARKLMHDVPRLARVAGQLPPYGWDEDCWHQELRETLIKRAQGKGKWNPARGRTTWASWATMVIQTRNINLRRQAVSSKANLVKLCSIEQMNMNTIESWSGDGLPGIQSGAPKWQRVAKAAQQRLRRAEQQRTRRSKVAATGVPPAGGT